MNHETNIDEVPVQFRERYAELIEIIDQFCDNHLDHEYKEVCRELTLHVCQDGSPVLRGKAASWAAGIIWSIGRVNFLYDPSFDPYLKQSEFAKLIGVSPATISAKSRIIWDALELIQLDPDFTVSSRLELNPLVWMLEIDGFILDIRLAPREVQEVAYQEGVIPYIPADRQEKQEK